VTENQSIVHSMFCDHLPAWNAIDLIPIADQVARGLIPRECLRDLACDPVRARICCDVDPDEISAGQPDDDEGIEQVEANAEQRTGPWPRCPARGYRMVRHP
jgi:hypothetical protein